MSTTTKVVLIVAAVLVVCAIGVAVTLSVVAGHGGMPSLKEIFQSATMDIDESQELDLQGVDRLSIENVSGRIIVAPGEPRATLTGRITTNTEKKTFLEVENVGGSLTVRADFNSIYPNFVSGDMVLTVYLPEETEIDTVVSGTSATADVSGIRFGSLSVNSTSGEVSVEDCAGGTLKASSTSGEVSVLNADFATVVLNSTSGSVTADGVTGAVTAGSTSGEVRLKNVAGAVTVDNTSGGAAVVLTQTEIQPVRIHAISGSVSLTLNPSAAFDLNVDTVSGGFSSEFDITVSGKLAGKVVGEDISGQVNGGGPAVELSTVSGGVSLTKAK
jgi:DUF4097 and DUF4098 domain-containing protein YvlB